MNTPTGAVFGDRVELLKAIAGSTRQQVLALLRDEGEHCHCEIEETLGPPARAAPGRPRRAGQRDLLSVEIRAVLT